MYMFPTAGLHDVLIKSFEKSFEKSDLKIPLDLLSVARDYACDGCYEPMFQGRSEFKFAYIFTLQVRTWYNLEGGGGLSEPHTSGTALQDVCVCQFACLCM